MKSITGRSPRGRGSWAFCTVDPRRGDYMDHIIWKSGTYSEAKRAAITEASGKFIILYVCS